MQVASGQSLAVRPADADRTSAAAGSTPKRIWIERLQLTDFRNYRSLHLELGPSPVVLTGFNGAGKTNLLEAVSLLTSGQGLRRAPYPDLARMGATRWTVAGRLVTPLGPLNIGTALATGSPESRRPHHQPGHNPGRIVHIDGEPQSGSGILAQHVEMVWLLPAMDGLFTGPASDRRRFLDRLICGLDPSYRPLLGQFERAMQHRNRLLADGARDGSRFVAFERIMAEAGVAIAAARAAAVAELAAAISARRNAGIGALFPWAELTLLGTLETELSVRPAIEVEDAYCELLGHERERDRAAGRTLEGPHRSDLAVEHGPKQMPAKICSTGEQKALLIGLVLAHCDVVRQRQHGTAPILLLDEIVAHLDPLRRAALLAEIIALNAQAWMSGTDPQPFSALSGQGQFLHLEEGRIACLDRASAAAPQAAPTS
ncbi:MAG: DNA replication/repair protein RecF [Hyphomicrobiaceae bacterium]|nr:DNA replication/repair protein RecF [Hyphomicrobiaceae bacterium]